MATLSSKGRPGDPLRARLLRDLILLVMITVGVLVGTSALLLNGVKHDLAEAQLQAASALVRDEVKGLLRPVQQQLLILRDGLRSRLLSPGDVEGLNTELIPALKHMDQIAGAAYADDAGREYFLHRENARWITRERAASPKGTAEAPARISQWADARELISSLEQSTTHDPRTRPWFKNAERTLTATGQQAAAAASWTAPYRFRSLDEPGVTVSTAWRANDGLQVLALDVTLARILTAIERFRGGVGRGFLFSREGGVYGPAGPDQEPAGFYSAEAQHGGAMVFEAVAAWRAAGEPEYQTLRFESGGEEWWGGFVPLEPTGRSTWVGVAFPGWGPLGLLQQRWPLFAIVAIAISILGIGLALLIVHRHSRQLRELPKLRIDHRQPERELYDLIGRGEGTHLELKSTMRWNLRAAKNDKAIELAWLKGVAAFMNTEGGILLLGVADDGEVLGLAPDGFANDDKCHLHLKNLVNQHLGAEATRFLRFTLFPLEDKQIGVIECEPADTPIFLRQGSGESLLIRTGPSNTELSISRALAYIHSRF